MRILLGIVAAFVFATGLVATRAAWLCHFRQHRAGWWLDLRAGLAAVVFLATMTGPLMIWVQRGELLSRVTPFYRFGVYLAIIALYLPFLTYHVGAFLTSILRDPPQPPPEPADPLERAKAAEARGDVRAAIERYSKLLEDEPTHVEVRTRFARLLARTRRFLWAIELVEQGLALEELSSVEKAEWKALLSEWEEGKLGEAPPEGGDLKELAIYKITTARVEAHEEGKKEKPKDERPIEL